MISILKEICVLSGVSSHEDEVRDYIVKFVKKYSDDMIIDVMGNVIVNKKGKITPEQKLVLCAHMDEVGVFITGFTEDGYLRFAKAGSFDNRVVLGKAIIIGKKRVRGIIGCKAMHMVKAKDRDKPMDIDEMYIDIGAENRAEAEQLVSPGDTGAFDEDVREFGDGYIKAKAIDDRFGCAVLLELIKNDLPVDCSFVFTVQEEVGLRGAHTAAYTTSPDITLVIEGTSAADLPSVPENKKVCKIGGGAVLPFMDLGTIYNKEIRSILIDIAEKNDIKWQTKTYVAGATDGSAFHTSRGGVKTAGIAAPVRNLHSPACVAGISDMKAVYKLIWLFLEKMGN